MGGYGAAADRGGLSIRGTCGPDERARRSGDHRPSQANSRSIGSIVARRVASGGPKASRLAGGVAFGKPRRKPSRQFRRGELPETGRAADAYWRSEGFHQ